MLTRVAPSCSLLFKSAFQYKIDRVFFHEIMLLARNWFGCKLSWRLRKITRYFYQSFVSANCVALANFIVKGILAILVSVFPGFRAADNAMDNGQEFP